MNRLFIGSLHYLGLIEFAINRTIGNYKPSWDTMKRDGTLPLPFYLNAILTQRCNLNCIMCHEQGNPKSRELELSTDQLCKLIDNAGPVKVAAVTGGEILIRNDIWDILGYLDSRNIELKISTNAYAVTDEIADRIAGLKHVGNVAISIDGPEPIHNVIRGRKDAFKRTTEAIRLFKKRGLRVSITSVLQPDNVDAMGDILETCHALRVDRVSIIPFTYKKPGEEAFVQKMFPGCTVRLPEKADTYRPFTETQLEAVKAAIKRYRARGLLCLFYPPFVSSHTGDYAADRPIAGSFVCKQFYQLFVNEQGKMYPCPFLDKSFGDIHTRPVAELWNSDELRDFRKTVALGGLFPFCRRCCALHRL